MALPVAGTGDAQDQFWPMPKFYFSVDIGDFQDLPFQEVSGLDVETEITLKKGVFADDNQFFDWISQISLNTYARLTVVIRLLDETATERMTWTLSNAFPQKVTPTDMNSQSSEAGIETIVFAHEGMVQSI